jgi:hypothetical protein
MSPQDPEACELSKSPEDGESHEEPPVSGPLPGSSERDPHHDDPDQEDDARRYECETKPPRKIGGITTPQRLRSLLPEGMCPASSTRTPAPAPLVSLS